MTWLRRNVIDKQVVSWMAMSVHLNIQKHRKKRCYEQKMIELPILCQWRMIFKAHLLCAQPFCPPKHGSISTLGF